MITTANYYSKTKNVDWSAVPASLKKSHETLIPDASKDGWQAYTNDEDIRRVVEKYFTYIAKYVPTEEAAPIQPPTKAAWKEAPTSSNAAERQRARELTVAFLRPYVERGETVEQINKSYLGTSNKSGSFQVKSNKVFVDRIGEQAVNYSFPLKSIFDEIKGVKSSLRRATQPKTVKKVKTADSLPEPKQVVFIPTATAFIKRYAALHGKVKTRDQVLSLTHGLQRAMTEQRIRANEPAHREISKMQSELIALATKMKDSAKIEIPEPYLTHYKQIAQGEEVRTSVKLLKQFIQLNGKAPDKARAQKLGAKLLKAFEEIPKEDPYRAELAAATVAIGRYVNGESNEVDIPVSTLHGLGSIAIGSGMNGLGTTGQDVDVLAVLKRAGAQKRNAVEIKRAFKGTANPSLCADLAAVLMRRKASNSNRSASSVNRPSMQSDYDGISGLDVLDWKLGNASRDTVSIAGLGSVTTSDHAEQNALPVKTVKRPAALCSIAPVSARDLAKMEFQTIGYHGRFNDVVGDPAMGFHMMVYGKPFQGKSSFVIELCKDLAALNKGRIAYLALEEGISASMQKKVVDRGAANVSGLDFIGGMLPSFQGYRFVVIDSVSDRSVKREALRELFLKNPDVCFICIFHATKDGAARGGLDFSHDMDIIIKIENHKPVVEKNRFI